MSANRRKAVRRAIGYSARIIASDGSWDRACRVLDVSQTGAKLAVEQATQLPKDFILALSQQGTASRRCRVVWAGGSEIGVAFERQAPP